MIESKHEYEIMAETEQHLWWYCCLHALVHKAISAHFDRTSIRIIDAGCGTGGAMKFLIKKGFSSIKGFDISPHALKICQVAKLPVVKSDARNIKKLYKNNSAEVIICNDMFYFLNDKERKALMAAFHSILTQDGIVVMNVPALDIFRGMHDKAVGINKRFSKKMLLDSFDPRLFSIVKILYWPWLLSPLILAARLLQRLSLAFNKKAVITSDVAMPAKPLNALFYFITSLENTFFPWKPWGSSLFVVLKKK